ncbi:MAG: pitrilysin family protein [Limnospira sp. PMC 1291.21]|uniref:Metalloendopeptidase, M16 family n=1 Tax=Limnospira indica PCC 8005 TaxID=376219 RepID=A0A9P1NWT4_9CYAN|nr:MULTISPECIES: pitrilysin family protein [Limnospira]MDT9177115.1 pitrilysin family protein [Limnospira sp. PMC 1238.20]MDT9202685.1 pitrilysin family protein [Limnospira sp. PMC 1243.20]MDT9223179.1 pitrilysin family protein [Limnospira sp. PMC 1279.21]MDT9228180.1 pitrilysin family protein [Limnospira sp. PMC 1242.20]MDT9238608.1 pitrilysin family protein [Limnospira sp. PMC 1261.20]
MTSILLESNITRSLNAPTIYKLSNGLTIVAEQLPVEAVNLNVWIDVGSAVEPDPINGMAHFLEHMVFKGTPNLKAGEFERLIEQRGALTNAATSQDYTHYYVTSAPADFATLAPLQLEVVFNPIIPDDAFERERLVVLEEIRRSEDNPARRSFQRTMETAFKRLPYRRSVLGPAAAIEQLTPQQMRDFHRSHYCPQKTTIAVVGNLPVETLIGTVAESIPLQTPPELPPEVDLHHLIPESGFSEIVRHEIIDDSLQQARLMMVWRVPGLNQLSETYALDVLATILGQGRTSRLVQDLRENRGLVSGISCSNMTQRLQGVFYISARLRVEHLAEAEAAIAEHINRLHRELITPTEMTRVRTQVANRFIFGSETPSDRANLYGYYQAIVGNVNLALEYPSQIQSLNAEQLQQAIRQYLLPQAYGVVILKPHTP